MFLFNFLSFFKIRTFFTFVQELINYKIESLRGLSYSRGCFEEPISDSHGAVIVELLTLGLPMT